MKIIEVENSKFAKLINAHIVLYPFVLYDGVPTLSVIKHELKHVEQINRIGVFKFYFTYLTYFISNLVKGMGWNEAYRNIPYEIEARAEEKKWV